VLGRLPDAERVMSTLTGQSNGGSHTPGPWEVLQGTHCRDVYSVPLHKVTTLKDGTVHHEGLVALVYGHHDAAGNYSLDANHRLIAAAPDMLAILDELEGAFDREIYPEQQKEDFDAPDDREYTVTITAKQWRAISRALSKAGAK
jgi:hypothetical protein